MYAGPMFATLFASFALFAPNYRVRACATVTTADNVGLPGVEGRMVVPYGSASKETTDMQGRACFELG